MAKYGEFDSLPPVDHSTHFGKDYVSNGAINRKPMPLGHIPPVPVDGINRQKPLPPIKSSEIPPSAPSASFTADDESVSVTLSRPGSSRSIRHGETSSSIFGSRSPLVAPEDLEPTGKKRVMTSGLKLALWIVFWIFLITAVLVVILVVVYFTIAKPKMDERDERHTTERSDVTTVSVDITTEEDYTIDAAGTWESWTAWSSCSLTCGGGHRSRTRTCASQRGCSGTADQVMNCNPAFCTGPDYGTWGSWSGWTACSETCDTGTQSRTRDCDRVGAELDCQGDATDTRDCNTQLCPDCSMTCSGSATLSADCTYCQCTNGPNGTITSDDGIPLSGVTISTEGNPTVTLATTDSNGFYSLNTCFPSPRLVMVKDGFVTEVTTLTDNFIMTRSVNLYFTVHPQSRTAVTGGDTTLCCEATGHPGPLYYEWFRNDVLINTEEGVESSTLVLNDLSVSDTGYYKCRANNDYSATYSTEAQLNVKGYKMP